MEQATSARGHMVLVCALLGLLLSISPKAMAQYGTVDPRFSPPSFTNGNSPTRLRGSIERPDGILVFGDFSHVGGVPRGGLALLDNNGAFINGFAAAGGANGPVHAVALVGTDKYLIAGDFTEYAGQARPRLAVILADGSLDTSFAPANGPNGPIYAVALSNTGYIVAGAFNSVGSATHNNIAFFQPTGELGFHNFAGGTNGAIYALYARVGSLIIGGDFTKVGEVSRERLAVFTSVSYLSSNLSASWSGVGADGPVYAISTVPGAGSSSPIVIGGDFNSIAGVPQKNLAMLSSTSSNYSVEHVLRTWVDGPVRSLSQSTNQLLIAGEFSSVDGRPRNGFARLYPNSNHGGNYEVSPSFIAGSGANGAVLQIAGRSDGSTLVFGEFTSVDSIPRQHAALLYGPTAGNPPAAPGSFTALPLSAREVALKWTLPPLSTGVRLERQKAGESTWVALPTPSVTLSFSDENLDPGTTYSYRVSASNVNGTGPFSPVITATTHPTIWTGPGSRITNSSGPVLTNGEINHIVSLPDGKVLLAGTFSTVNGAERRSIARVNSDFTVDLSFQQTEIIGGQIEALSVQPDGRIYIGGSFTRVQGSDRYGIARLLNDGALDTTFNPGTGPNGPVRQIGIHGAYGVILYGNFNSVGATPRNRLARLNFDGTLDLSFAPRGQEISGFDITKDGRIFVCGGFSNWDGTQQIGVAALNPDGSLDRSFVPTSNNPVDKLIAGPNGHILIRYSYNSSGLYLENLKSDGQKDPDFISPAFSGKPGQLIVQPDGKIVLAGGGFQVAGNDKTHSNFVRLAANGTVDPGFSVGGGAHGKSIRSLEYASDGSIFVGSAHFSWSGLAPGDLLALKGDAPTLPLTTGSIFVTAVSSEGVEVRWSDVPNATEYLISRSQNGVDGWQQVGVSPWRSTVFADFDLKAGTTWHYKVEAKNAAGTAASPIAAGTTFTMYQQWKVDQGMPMGTAGDDLDDDEDGIPAIMEYALGLDPAVQTTEGMPVHQLINGTIALSYRKFRKDVTYIVESSEDLTTWTADGVNQGSGAFPIAWSLMGPAPQKYLRLQITAE